MRSHGIDVSKYDESFLDKSLQKRIRETHCGSLEKYCTFLEQDNKERNIFLDSLHVNYSEFFRNTLTFAVLERIVLPGMGRQGEVLKCGRKEVRKCGSMGSMGRERVHTRKRELRIWSAACAGGQEAYSLAILLEELKNSDSEKFNYRIFATDQDETQVNEARKGEYSAAALNNLSLKRANQWFIRHGETYTVKPELKKNMEFSVFDLFSENLSSPPGSIFGDFDLVFCANLLFYYKDKYRKTILDKTGNCLADGGFLVVGEAEREILMNYGYREVFPQSGVFKKN
jgi:chemotaxis methyl-accepting protein methylase